MDDVWPANLRDILRRKAVKCRAVSRLGDSRERPRMVGTLLLVRSLALIMLRWRACHALEPLSLPFDFQPYAELCSLRLLLRIFCGTSQQALWKNSADQYLTTRQVIQEDHKTQRPHRL
ncbi:prohibitin [Aspergillus luchuensis]|uniref:Prohibitin n=1 Tax=Aspergillus kawachii TaxID=1069201 RepID=A0A146FFJ4_ASPKA|nr:prohibitin [Aspergillus luchuensis]